MFIAVIFGLFASVVSVVLGCYQWLVRRQYQRFRQLLAGRTGYATTVTWSIEQDSAWRVLWSDGNAAILTTPDHLLCFPYRLIGGFRWYLGTVLFTSDGADTTFTPPVFTTSYPVTRVRYGLHSIEMISETSGSMASVTTKVICTSADPEVIPRLCQALGA